MQSLRSSQLSPEQLALVEEILPGSQLLADLGWGLIDTKVLHVRNSAGEFIIKASGPHNHHLVREINAHVSVVPALTAQDLAPRLRYMNREHSLLITEYLPGTIAEGTPSQFECDVHRQAGFILRQLHALAVIQDPDYEERQIVKALGWLEKPHRIAFNTQKRVREILLRYHPRPVVVVPSHGDWHARNWLLDNGKVRAIDFGRFEHRPALYDLWRLARREWQDRPELEHAFLDGYGGDPREPDLWQIILLREAISTAVWAFEVGDERFEQQGHAMIADSLATWIE